MTSRGSDSAFEQQAALLIVEESLPGSCRAEALRLSAIAIGENGGSWNLHCGLAQVCVRRLGIEARWPIETNLNWRMPKPTPASQTAVLANRISRRMGSIDP